MVLLRLDPRYPLVWRSPDAIQLGGRQPLVVLDHLTRAEERMLGALRKGVPDDGLAVHGRCATRTADALLARVAPALLAPPPPSLSITVRARDEQGRRIAELARTLGLLSTGGAGASDGTSASTSTSPESPSTRTSQESSTASPTSGTDATATNVQPRRVEAGLLVGIHAIPPVAYRDWLRRDLPHIGIVLGDTGVQISPVVVPGQTPCLRCAELHRRDEDPCWPAVATQLIAEPAAAAEDPLLRLMALATAVRRLREALIGRTDQRARPRGEPRTLCISMDGSASAVESPAHPECGCLVDLQLASRAAA